MKKKVLFICAQNSARSQIAAALLNKLCGDYFEAHSAGLEPGALNPFAVEALQELGIDISRNKTQSVFDVWNRHFALTSKHRRPIAFCYGKCRFLVLVMLLQRKD